MRKLTLLLFLLPARLLGQEADPSGESGQVFEMSPFEVEGDDVGYSSMFSTTGTRVRESIDKLPFNVSVVTKDLMEDFLADSLEEQFAYTSAFSPGEDDLSSQIRGIAAPGRLRNGFTHVGITDRVNTRRVEVIKGPAASIYGRVQPGGVLNYVTETPTEYKQQKLGLYTGTDGYHRIDGVMSGPLIDKKLLYFAGAAVQRKDFPQEFGVSKRAFGTVSVEYRFPKSWIRAEFEAVRNDQSPVATLPYNYRRLPDNPAGPRVTDGYAWELFDFNNFGPDAFEDQEVYSGSITFEHKFSRNLNLRVAGAYNDYKRERLVIAGDRYLVDPDPGQRMEIFGRNPTFRWDKREQSALQADLLYSFRRGETEGRVLLTADYSNERTDQFFLGLENGWDRDPSHPFFHVRSIDPQNPDYTLPAISDLTNRFREQSTDTDIFGVFASGQLAFWQDRLITMVGGRYDYSRYDTADRTAGNFSDYTDSDTTYQTGANFQLVPGLRAYGNYSTSFYPQSRLSPEGLPFPNERGVGWELGLKGELFKGRLNYSMAYFDVTRKNIAIRTRDENDLEVFLLAGEVASTGFEVDFNFDVLSRIWGGLELKGGYGYVEAEYVKMENAALVGLTPPRVPLHNLGVASVLRFNRGLLRGSFLTASVRHMSEARGTDSTNSWRHLNYQPAYTVWNLTFGYRYTSPARKIYNRFQVTFKNVFDEVYLSGRRRGEPQSVAVRWEIRF
jgi:iron complex outermembrane recepter protein